MTTEEIIAWKNFPNIFEKARSKANRRYPSILEIDDDAEFGEYDINEAKREVFIEGYLEAERDLGWISVKDRLPEETCKDSLQVPETCKENTDSLTSLEEAAKEYSERVSRGHNYRDLTCGFIAGAKWQREQMMEEAVEGKVFMSFAPGHNHMVMADVDLPINTKVKLIIVKED